MGAPGSPGPQGSTGTTGGQGAPGGQGGVGATGPSGMYSRLRCTTLLFAFPMKFVKFFIYSTHNVWRLLAERNDAVYRCCWLAWYTWRSWCNGKHGKYWIIGKSRITWCPRCNWSFWTHWQQRRPRLDNKSRNETATLSLLYKSFLPDFCE
jgi:hypothetical protein